MRIVCISSSNMRKAGSSSTSLKACLLIQKIIAELMHGACDFQIIQLVDSKLQPCDGCGECYHVGRCSHDEEFNGVYDRFNTGDAVFIVSAHYAPIPSKLCAFLEKVEQLAFLPRFNNEDVRGPFYKKPIGIVAHGGGTEEIMRQYEAPVLNTIANALSWPVEMTIVKDPISCGNGVIFPVEKVDRSPDTAFPVHTYDWQDIRKRIEPLVKAVLARISHTRSVPDGQ